MKISRFLSKQTLTVLAVTLVAAPLALIYPLARAQKIDDGGVDPIPRQEATPAPTPAATARPTPLPTSVPVPTPIPVPTPTPYKFDINMFDYMEALRGNKSGISVSDGQKVYVWNWSDPEEIKAEIKAKTKNVRLSAKLGVLDLNSIITTVGYGYTGGFLRTGLTDGGLLRTDTTDGSNTSGNYQPIESSEPSKIAWYTSTGVSGWGEVTAEVEGTKKSRNVLLHRVRVKDFDEPQILRYVPNSDEDELAHPRVDFTIDDNPKVGAEFQVTCGIFSLEGHQPIATRTWLVNSAGDYSKNWSDFFFSAGTPQSDWEGRSLDPGEGIYPFQIKVTCTKMKQEILDGMGIKYVIGQNGITVSDWKASQSLTIKPQRQNAWSLSYDEGSGTTKLAYVVDIYSANGKEPQKVRVDVYDPELNKVGEVTNQTITRWVSDDGKTFTYFFNGPVNLEMAGDYHFVVEAQSAADDLSAQLEDKDAGKWALEQNSSGKVPTFVTFGGKSPGVSGPGLGSAFGQTLDMSGVSIAAGDRLIAGGYKVLLPKPAPWWTTKYRGVYADKFSSVADVVGLQYPNGNQNKQQAIQYNAVWLYAGHGGGGKLMAVWDPAGGSSSKINTGHDDPNWSYLSSDGTGIPQGASSQYNVNLSLLPRPARGYFIGNNFNQVGYANPLQYARLVCFIGCETANYSASDLPSTAVRLGARNAIGLTRITTDKQDIGLTISLFDYLQPSKTKPNTYDLYEAARLASYDTFGDYRTIRVAGKTLGSGVFGTNVGWGGDGLGPEGR